MVKDVEFLNRHRLMDYSLLLLVENNQEFINVTTRKHEGIKQRSPVIEGLRQEALDQILISQNQKPQRNDTVPQKSPIVSTFGAENLPELFSSFSGSRHKYISENGKFIYHIAIIDYLQEFNLEKQLESKTKVWLLNRDQELISAVPPS